MPAPMPKKAQAASLDLKTILVPIDFSKTSLKALKYAIPFAEQFGAKIILLHAFEPPLYPDDVSMAVTIPAEERMLELNREKLEKLAKDNVPASLLGAVMVRTGPPFRLITELAGKRHVDLIILTTHGYTGLKHVFMGSVAERVVRHAPCPVLVVRDKEHEFV